MEGSGMTRFLYLTDTHVGGEAGGYHQQPRYLMLLPQLINSLDQWILEHPGIAFILHGGDMVELPTEENIRAARDLFSLSVPVYLCLGNHDMAGAHALDIWLREAPNFFPQGTANYTLDYDGVQIHVLPNHWDDTHYFWDGAHLRPHFREEQVRYLQAKAGLAAPECQILCTHSEVAAVPIGQTGFVEPYHAPIPEFVDAVRALGEGLPNLRCFLSGHNHINTSGNFAKEGVKVVTTSSFTETPFEFKVIDIEPGRLTMRTENLVDECGFAARYNFDKTFVQGRLKDRAFDLYWEQGETHNDR
ncbi:MAG: hypothetical protein E4H27_06380 [Anaerolineales bacterium]|nr:MAG: hypothetical protein E4H27_06380 [Anaerolineales bacterium]